MKPIEALARFAIGCIIGQILAGLLIIVYSSCTKADAKPDYSSDPNMRQFITPPGASKASVAASPEYPFILLHPSEKRQQEINQLKR